MSNKEKRNPVIKYLEAKEFVEYCNANNVDASLESLEAYEKAGLLFPVYRVILPAEYKRAEFDSYRNPNVPVYINDKYQEIDELEKALGLYHTYYPTNSYFKEALEKGHPLDYAYGNNSFLHKPTKADFKPWKEYNDSIEHYYAYWQIFVIDELNHKHTIKENYITSQKKEHSIYLKNIHPSKRLEYSELFQTVSNFEMKESLIWIEINDIALSLKQSVIEGKLHEELNKRRAAVAVEEYGRRPHAEWVKFIIKLVELYDMEYLKREKIRLSNELKSFLKHTIEMIMAATGKSFEEICNEYDGRFKDGLERIFPDEIKQIKERSQEIIDSCIKEFNKKLSDVQIVPNIKVGLIENIINSNHWALLSHLHQINELWFHRSLHWESSIWAHIRSLVVSIESVGKEWFGGAYLSNVLKNAFGQFNNLVKTIETAIGENIKHTATFVDYERKLNKILGHRKNNPQGICGHHLVVTYLTRNYLSHNVVMNPEMLGSSFLAIFENLIFTLISLYVQKP